MEEVEETYTYEVQFYVSTKYIGSDVKEVISVWQDLGYSDQEWDELDSYEQEEQASNYLNEWVWQQLDTGWKMVDE